MRLLLDTHFLIWLATDRQQLTLSERAAVMDLANDLYVSAVSIWELRTKLRSERRRGRSELTLTPAAAIAFCAENEIAIHPFTVADCTAILHTEPTNNDPFDEMILIHAQLLEARLLTRDEHLVDHPLAYQS